MTDAERELLLTTAHVLKLHLAGVMGPPYEQMALNEALAPFETPTKPADDDAMPKYRSHKEVHALQVARVDRDGAEHPSKAMVHFLGSFRFGHPIAYPPRTVDIGVFSRGEPQAGDYLVFYPDGYISWSPRAAFEDGYTRI